nr:hypothetical protein [Tanacetum cinerariifolium]
REKAVVNSPQPIYDQEPSMVDDDEDTISSGEDVTVKKEEAGIQLNAEQADWRDDTDDESDDQ